mmetsp:Transcript_7922/g.12015  ORF Transcript_7922/g.12015 Transcript_7922/m.12015 type:complete len:210 (-) Transcript_7922:413-1042(-)
MISSSGVARASKPQVPIRSMNSTWLRRRLLEGVETKLNLDPCRPKSERRWATPCSRRMVRVWPARVNCAARKCCVLLSGAPAPPKPPASSPSSKASSSECGAASRTSLISFSTTCSSMSVSRVASSASTRASSTWSMARMPRITLRRFVRSEAIIRSIGRTTVRSMAWEKETLNQTSRKTVSVISPTLNALVSWARRVWETLTQESPSR